MIFSEIDEFVIMQREYRRTIRHAKNIRMFIHIINQNKENHISMIKFTRINIAFKNVFNWLCKVYGKYYG